MTASRNVDGKKEIIFMFQVPSPPPTPGWEEVLKFPTLSPNTVVFNSPVIGN